MLTWLRRTLMGTPYEYQMVPAAPPVTAHRMPLEQPRSDLARHESIISEHRRRSAQSDAPTIPRALVQALLDDDAARQPDDADVVQRRARALQAEFSDAPVMHNGAGAPQVPTIDELAEMDRERRRQLRRDRETFVPVMRR